ncbi:MAG: hypothetical protein ACK40O_08410 [Allosphingosinicella sp.]
MARGDETNRVREGDEAKRRLGAAILRSRAILAQYRARLLLLRQSFDRAPPAASGRDRQVPAKSLSDNRNRRSPARS